MEATDQSSSDDGSGNPSDTTELLSDSSSEPSRPPATTGDQHQSLVIGRHSLEAIRSVITLSRASNPSTTIALLLDSTDPTDPDLHEAAYALASFLQDNWFEVSLVHNSDSYTDILHTIDACTSILVCVKSDLAGEPIRTSAAYVESKFDSILTIILRP